MSGFFHDNWMMSVIAVGVGVVALTSWLKTPDAKNVLMDFCLTIPFIREALRDMYFGLWARYMALMVEAGIPTATALSVTAPVLPGALQQSVIAFERDLADNRSLSDAADPAKLKAGDARSTWWPFYISNAFVIAEQTGTIDRELLRVAPALIKEGVRKLDVALWIGQVVALAVSGLLIVSPLAAYYNEVFAALKNAGH